MDVKTLFALKASVARWEYVADVQSVSEMQNRRLGMDSCPLCRAFHSDFVGYTKGLKECNGCPVRESTNKPFCRGTPYQKARKLRFGTDVEAFQGVARAELDFLRSLLPDGERA